MARICVIDDKDVLRDSILETLERRGHSVSAFGDPVAAMDAIWSEAFDLVLTDLRMPKMDGLEVIRRLKEMRHDAPVIVMTAFGTVSTAVEAMRLGAFDFVQKPFEAEHLVMQVERAITHKELKVENEAWRASVSDLRRSRVMVGQSAAIQEVLEKIAQYAASDATVLISGASGTGKELAASAIQSGSRRADKPMLCLNCAALSENLLESELFGHERGAFTGADRQRKGRFELADGGTLLLDEISEMALPLQGKLLRVLQEGEFERVGSSVTLRADVRVIATTNRKLDEWAARNEFRSDLYYRLNVLPLPLPSLRDRRGDVPLLVEHFLGKMALESGATPLEVRREAMEALKGYGWPGNIRELENVCQRAVATVRGDVIEVADVELWLSGRVSGSVGSIGSGGSGGEESALENLRHGRMLEDMERKLIERTLNQYGGHRARSAKALGMGVRTLGLRLKQWREEQEAQLGHSLSYANE
jgi:DNA-binding NtrC family response regulator